MLAMESCLKRTATFAGIFADNLFGDFIYSYEKQFPSDPELYWLRYARVNFWGSWRSWLIVVE